MRKGPLNVQDTTFESIATHLSRQAREGDWHGDATYVGMFLGRVIDELRSDNSLLKARVALLERYLEEHLTGPTPPQPRNQMSFLEREE